MGEKSSIQWVAGDDGVFGSTWNPVRGCSRVSTGCVNCYAERAAIRQVHGALKGFVESTKNGPRWTGRVELVPDKLHLPLSWRRPRRIFVNSQTDLFHEKLTNEEIAACFAVMAAAHH